ncbi:hypothetical protein DLJ96_08575 [Actinotalea fermentans ATCC 43279 = JCM 9966 = DSM 3133]|nr:hypothetical protein DLJ96_08575 [Actinotalea fermentans ATCC 43279 = JCM 9966 = DSM 3133]
MRSEVPAAFIGARTSSSAPTVIAISRWSAPTRAAPATERRPWVRTAPSPSAPACPSSAEIVPSTSAQ